MKQLLLAAFIGALATTAFAQDADSEAVEYQKCSITPASAIGPMFDTQTVAECEAACNDAAGEGCTAWSFQPPSDMFPENPGKCRLIKTIFKEEESTRSFCGKL